jgi:penicillin-binding protein 1A
MGRFGAVLAALAVILCAAATSAAYLAYKHYSAGLPSVEVLKNYQPRVMSRVYAGNMHLLSELATERRIFVPYASIPDLVKRAFLAAEDQSFFTHGGVDPLAIIRAAATDFLLRGPGRHPVGASTITQQVVKNMLLTNQVSLSRKIREALLAMRVERTLSKERILEIYLNEIYLGEGAYGVAAAAQTYFDKPLAALTPAEAAFLAALPKAPNNYNPQRFPDAARARRDWVLDRMVDTGAISQAIATEAKAQPVIPKAHETADVVTGADFFADEVKRRLIDRFGVDEALQGGLVVRTSLDPTLQAEADKALRAGLLKYDEAHGGWRGAVTRLPAGAAVRAVWQQQLARVARPPGMLADWQMAAVLDSFGGQALLGVLDQAPDGTVTPRLLPMYVSDSTWARPVYKGGGLGPTPHRMSDIVRPGDVVMVEVIAAVDGKAPRPARALLRQIPTVQGALVTIDPMTGRVLAMAGGWSHEASQFNRATQAMRQPGSSFKPCVYLTAMEKGISPSQEFLDAPFVLNDWKPQDYEQTYSGWVPLHTALEKSLNLVTVRLAEKVGMDAVATNAIAFHIVDSMPKVLPAALGAVDSTVLRMAGFYAALDAGGREVTPTLIDSVEDRYGRIIYAAPAVACDGCGDPAQPPTLVDQRQPLADPQSVFQVVTMMQGVVQHGTGVAAGQGLNRAIAGKTGTTQDWNDAWFVGFTPDLVTAVWVGFDTPSTLGKDETGGALAAPIWHDFMAAALQDRPALSFVPPPGVTLATYDQGWGRVTDAFKDGQRPGANSGDATASADGTPDGADNGGGGGATGGGTAAGVDSGLGGLY